MITEIIFFDLPAGTDRAAVTALYEVTAESWAKNPDLIEKYYFFDEQSATGGGVYIWRDRAAAQRWHGEDYVRMVRERYGAPPRIQILDAVVHVDAVAGRYEIL